VGAVRKVLPLLWPSDALLAMPGSSSESNRALVAAALYGRSMTISGATPSDDVRHMANGLAKLGFVVTLLGDTVDSVRVGARRADAPRCECIATNPRAAEWFASPQACRASS
jgi:5-enolpyruvylshikimate-3-phosphate synthase